MRVSPLMHAYLYFLIGILFVYFAFEAIDETVLNPLTIFLTILATLDFGASYRLFKLHLKIKQKKNQK
ncbi:hypothetical protein GCM10012290_23360 [Halolactibacillus alkaliphilus]|uniref:DUF4305 domain-containing protein n=1 Tax=Halolactibacillus alkaliphilus TaxID=442899 RepID=A0A511X487_9BACI|nr:YdiK family protein [Halolactibacillus alkaliphilus]GEN57757.1 hypothetical protein HAL01_22210 [Halolactibacillus alkaliphilus]GGN74969.1 hypothetical protein GCM10012290_23360 [Halolactibacillus alkaliphilus]SFP03974.1 protein of unknown function [Halolactibacillus alkaliphilus]